MLINCPNCGTILPGDAEFCPKCGTKRPTEDKACMFCGKPVSYDATYCAFCGRSLQDEIPVQTETPHTPYKRPIYWIGTVAIGIVLAVALFFFPGTQAGAPIVANSGTPAHTTTALPQLQQTLVGTKYALTPITEEKTGLTLARCIAPQNWEVTPVANWGNGILSANTPMQITITAASADEKASMRYFSPVSYKEIISFSEQMMFAQQPTIKTHVDGEMDTESLTLLKHYENASAYADAQMQLLYPNATVKLIEEIPLSQALQTKLDIDAKQHSEQLRQTLSQSLSSIIGLTTQVDSTQSAVTQRLYSVVQGGVAYRCHVITGTEMVQINTNVGGIMVYTRNEESVYWSVPFFYIYAAQEDAFDTYLADSQMFVLNTRLGDAYTRAVASAGETLVMQGLFSLTLDYAQMQSTIISSIKTQHAAAAANGEVYTADISTNYLFESNRFVAPIGEIYVPKRFAYLYQSNNLLCAMEVQAPQHDGWTPVY